MVTLQDKLQLTRYIMRWALRKYIAGLLTFNQVKRNRNRNEVIS